VTSDDVVMDAGTAQAVALETGKLDDINVVAAPGTSKAAAQQAIAKVLPPGVEARCPA
jgi:hypothetical protein